MTHNHLVAGSNPARTTKSFHLVPEKNQGENCMGWSLPVEGLWVSPSGEMRDVNEHLLALKEDPEWFNLSNVPNSIDELRKLAENLIANGWVRYRYLDGVYNFEVDNARNKIQIIEKILAKAHAIPQEEIAISEINGKFYQGKVEDLYERSLFRFASKKIHKWAWSSLKRKI